MNSENGVEARGLDLEKILNMSGLPCVEHTLEVTLGSKFARERFVQQGFFQFGQGGEFLLVEGFEASGFC